MARDYTKTCKDWRLASDDYYLLQNVVTNLVADNITTAFESAEAGMCIFSHPKTGEPSILYSVGDDWESHVPISHILADAEPELLAKITVLLKEYCDRC